jgi:hypothetical protein
MEFAAFVSLWSAEMVLRLACAKLAEVFGGLGDDVCEELELDPAQWFACHKAISTKNPSRNPKSLGKGSKQSSSHVYPGKKKKIFLVTSSPGPKTWKRDKGD